MSSCELAPSMETETLTVEEFRVEPEVIQRGELATIHWSVRGAIHVEVTPDLGVVTGAGRMQLLPPDTTTYRLRATGADGDVTRAATVLVRTPEPGPDPLRRRRGRLIPVSLVD